MQLLRPKSAVLYLLTASVLFVPNAAHALEGMALWEKLVEKYSASTTISWLNSKEPAPHIVDLRDLKIAYPNGTSTTIKSIKLQDFTESEDGQLLVGNMVMEGVSSPSNELTTLTIQSIKGDNIKFPEILLKGDISEDLADKRIEIGALTTQDISFQMGDRSGQLKSLNLNKADIPLKYRYSDSAPSTGPIIPPLSFHSFNASGFSGKEKALEWSLASIDMTGAAIPTSTFSSPADMMNAYRSLLLKEFSIKLNSTDIYSLKALASSSAEPEADGTIASTTTLEGMVLNLKAIPHPQTQLIASELGYDTIEAAMAGVGRYTPSTGRMAINHLNLKLKDMAKLSMNYAITGYTKEAAAQNNLLQGELASGTPMQTAIGKYMESLSGIKLEKFNLTLTDDSLTGKLLEFQGKQIGMNGDQLAQGAPMFVGMGMAGLQMPEFTEMVTSAVGTFLQNKGSLTVETQLQEPISIVETMIAAQGDPKVIPEMLKLNVSGQ